MVRMSARDLPCAVCGKLMWTGTASLPAGLATCNPCRAKRQTLNACRRCGAPARKVYCSRDCWEKRAGGASLVTGRTCEVCQTPYRAAHADQRTCGRACGVILRREVTGTFTVSAEHSNVRYAFCDYCAELFVAHSKSPRRYCHTDDCDRRRAVTAKANNKATVLIHVHNRRASMSAQWIEDVDPRIVYERDKWTCHLCGEAVDRSGERGPWMPSLDHVTPISLGGLHSYANTACSHYRCNLSKGNRVAQ